MTASKLVLNASSGVGGAGLDVDEVFSTHLYDGTGSAQNINNGIALGSGTSLVGKTITNLGSSFDIGLSNINDGVFETSNAQNIAYTSGTFDIYVDMGSAVILNAYLLAPQGDQGGSTYNTPTGFTVSGSNNTSSWTTIQTFSNITGFAAGSFKTFEFTNTTAYRYYRLAASNTGVSLSEWKVRTSDDADGEGGLVWIKDRENANSHFLSDTEQGRAYSLKSDTNQSASAVGASYGITGFNSNGFSLGLDWGSATNGSGQDHVSWTFRKAKKFFDVVTWTGDGTSNRTLSHNLGSNVGMIIAKSTSTTTEWMVWHTAMVDNEFLRLNTTAAQGGYGSFYEAGITSTTIGVTSTSANYGMNINGESYVAYIFAHNNNDGGFGPDGDADIIKCGSYTGNGSSTGPSVNLGFEPQWLLIKNVSSTSSWIILDNMRGLPVEGNVQELFPHLSNAETTSGNTRIDLTPTGFTNTSSATNYNTNGDTYIYMAIRRGPLNEPENATDVFQPHIYTGDGSTRKYSLSITPDMVINANRGAVGDANAINDRLRGSGVEMYTDQSSPNYASGTAGMQFDYTNAIEVQNYRDTNSSTYLNLCWKRAPSYFDMVAYSGTGSNRTVTHNLGAVPEMMWVKKRSSGDDWFVYVGSLGNTNKLELNSTSASGSAAVGGNQLWNSTTPTSSVFSVSDNVRVNESGETYIAYLFATVAGVSKVGSYTGTGSDQNIDCGFSSGARFVMVKKTNSSGHWWIFDSARGITAAGNDPYLELDTTAAEDQNYNSDVDPYSSGFTISGADPIFNGNGSSFIFYAIA